jgi:hypothetical protein
MLLPTPDLLQEESRTLNFILYGKTLYLRYMAGY